MRPHHSICGAGRNARMHGCKNAARAEARGIRRLHSCMLAFLHRFAAGVAAPPIASAHDLERTRVSLTFSRDGSFVLDVSNDPAWLKLRLESFPGPFADRIVLFVDGHEVRPTSTEFIPQRADVANRDLQRGTSSDAPLATYRLRGRMPLDARTLRWYLRSGRGSVSARRQARGRQRARRGDSGRRLERRDRSPRTVRATGAVANRAGRRDCSSQACAANSQPPSLAPERRLA